MMLIGPLRSYLTFIASGEVDDGVEGLVVGSGGVGRDSMGNDSPSVLLGWCYV